MKSKCLMKAIGNIDDRYIIEAEPAEQAAHTSIKSPVRIWRLLPLAASLVIVIVAAAFALYRNSHWFVNQGDNEIPQNHAKPDNVTAQNPQSNYSEDSPYIVNKPSNFLVLTAYASAKEGQVLTANFLSEASPTVLQPNVEVLLPEYTPLTSSVPGLPFTFGTGEYGYDISITVDNGELLGWNQETGSITHYGKSAACSSGETLYWSPIDEGSTTSSATISVSVTDGEKMIGKQKITITETKPGFYSATAGELNVI